MKFINTPLAGAYLIELEKQQDDRGFLARVWDKKEFGLDLLQGYTCLTKKMGTLRGLHYMTIPETKITRVIRGRLYEVILDLRTKQWLGLEFSESDYKLLVIPPGCAHAVLTLEDNTEYTAYYSSYYDESKEYGIRFDDPTFAIKWPIPVTIVSEKDRSWPNYDNR